MKERYLPAFNHEFKQLSLEDGSAFVPFCGKSLDDILCEQFERTVGNDNCVHFDRMKLQIPANPYRMHYVKVIKFGYIVIQMEGWQFFMVRENRLTMMKTGYYWIQKRMLQRKSAAHCILGKSLRPYCLRDFQT